MNRSDFLKKCGAGVCGCGVLSLLAPLAGKDYDTGEPSTSTPEDADLLKQQLDGARDRFAKLLVVMAGQVDAATREKLLLGMGSQCSQAYAPFFNKYRGDLQGFLDKIKTAWVERTEYDETNGILHTIGKPGPCACPLVKVGVTPAEFCDCSRGWTQSAFSTVLGRPVTVKIEESVLRGGTRCSFGIGIKG